jgi:Icc-related predicted phosphoesterase
MPMKVLSLSDVVIPHIYSAQIAERFADIDFGIGCGDLPYYYQEYVVSRLDIPFFYVRGNHSQIIERTGAGAYKEPQGAIDLHRRVLNHDGLLLAGVEGCGRYREGPYQYTQDEMWMHVFMLVPGLFRNKALTGRYLDLLVTHAPPRGIHDQDDLPHQGIKAFRWLLKVFKPPYHFHGHIHVYHPDTIIETNYRQTRVINTFGYRETVLELSDRRMGRTRQSTSSNSR